jgi:hypothetical protein
MVCFVNAFAKFCTAKKRTFENNEDIIFVIKRDLQTNLSAECDQQFY